jgi:hypothetical protein
MGGGLGSGGELARSVRCIHKTFLALPMVVLLHLHLSTPDSKLLFRLGNPSRGENALLQEVETWRLVVCKGGRSANKFRISQIRKLYLRTSHKCDKCGFAICGPNLLCDFQS